MTRQILTTFVALGVLSGPMLALCDNLEEGSWAVMVFGGLHKPKPGGIDNEGVFGIRGARALTDRWVAVGSLGHSDIGRGQQTLLDANMSYVFRPDKRLSMVLTGGIGHAFVNDIAERDSFTMNVGFGPMIGLNSRLMIRVLNRFRWFESRDDDNVDQEITIALVIKLRQ
ncbi:MAG: hypothetical protein V3U43_10290 [Pseudomonadales bacterium]